MGRRGLCGWGDDDATHTDDRSGPDDDRPGVLRAGAGPVPRREIDGSEDRAEKEAECCPSTRGHRPGDRRSRSGGAADGGGAPGRGASAKGDAVTGPTARRERGGGEPGEAASRIADTMSTGESRFEPEERPARAGDDPTRRYLQEIGRAKLLTGREEG